MRHQAAVELRLLVGRVRPVLEVQPLQAWRSGLQKKLARWTLAAPEPGWSRFRSCWIPVRECSCA